MKKFILLLFGVGLVNVSLEASTFTFNNTDFDFLYNNYRVAGLSRVPWVGSWWAYKNNGIDYRGQYSSGETPASKYDRFFNLNSQTSYWERSNHTCQNQSGENLKSCEGWWGHCNAWAAAALKEDEPRSAQHNGQMILSVGDQKALLTELYMENDSLIVGQTDKSNKVDSWIFNENSSIARSFISPGVTSYQAYWDVDPRTFFLVLTNYLGHKKVGVVIDRFTGDQVWNQPLAAYRILPISSSDIKGAEYKNGQKVYPVLIKMSMYWANDGVGEEEISDSFNVHYNTDDNFRLGDFKVNKHYTGRSLAFYLFFDKQISINSNGKIDGDRARIIGPGMWWHQSSEGQKYMSERGVDFNNLHPDFIWYPNSVLDYAGQRNYRNPHITGPRVRNFLGKTRSGPSEDNNRNTNRDTNRDTVYECHFESSTFFGRVLRTFKATSINSEADACKKANKQCQRNLRRHQRCRRS